MGEGRGAGLPHSVVTDAPDVDGPARLPLPVPALEEGLPELGPEHEALLAGLDEPNLVLSDAYVGADRRRSGLLARLRRATYGHRRAVLRLEVLVAGVVLMLVAATLVLSRSGPAPHATARSATPTSTGRAARAAHGTSRPVRAVPATASPAPTSTPSSAPPSTPSTAAAPSTTAAPTAAAAAPPPPATTTTTAPAPVSSGPPSPSQLGAQALTLVRYPWRSIPGYSIQFLPIADAPSAGFYGNTVFTWGQTGGTSTLYVYPGETVSQLAGIIAFEIAHEVDAAAVEPEGGETQIENVLGIHPASWAPNCDCAEQNYLSGWYAATFSNYWSPGVGAWSQIAPEPSGAVLAAVSPWLDPTIP
jgi:hypothetical protein